MIILSDSSCYLILPRASSYCLVVLKEFLVTPNTSEFLLDSQETKEFRSFLKEFLENNEFPSAPSWGRFATEFSSFLKEFLENDEFVSAPFWGGLRLVPGAALPARRQPAALPPCEAAPLASALAPMAPLRIRKEILGYRKLCL